MPIPRKTQAATSASTPRRVRRFSILFLIILFGLVYDSANLAAFCAPAAAWKAGIAERARNGAAGGVTLAKQPGNSKASQAPSGAAQIPALPEAVGQTRLAILRAAASGSLDEMRYVLEKNELPPKLATESVGDPVSYWKEVSADGGGAEIMAILVNLLTTDFVKISDSGEEMYVWPGFADRPLATLSPAELVALYRIAPPARVAAMRAAGHYDYYRLGIGGDGTWHFFYKEK